MNANHFAARLKELRELAALTQPQLAEWAGLSKAGIADLEQGRRKPGWETVLKLAAALGVEASAFEAAPATTIKPQGRGRPKKATPAGGKRTRKKA